MIKLVLEIRHLQGKPDITCPIFVCDHCRKPIEKASQGMAHWRYDQENNENIDENVQILHKNPCSREVEALERQQGDGLFSWWELQWLIGYLINNTGVDWNTLIEEFCPLNKIMEVKKPVRGIKKEDAGSIGGF